MALAARVYPEMVQELRGSSSCPVAVAEPAKTANDTPTRTTVYSLSSRGERKQGNETKLQAHPISYATPTLLQYTQVGVTGSWFLA